MNNPKKSIKMGRVKEKALIRAHSWVAMVRGKEVVAKIREAGKRDGRTRRE